MIASCRNNVDIAGILLDFGADINERTPDGETAVVLAVQNPRIMQLLIDRGADTSGLDEALDEVDRMYAENDRGQLFETGSIDELDDDSD